MNEHPTSKHWNESIHLEPAKFVPLCSMREIEVSLLRACFLASGSTILCFMSTLCLRLSMIRRRPLAVFLNDLSLIILFTYYNLGCRDWHCCSTWLRLSLLLKMMCTYEHGVLLLLCATFKPKTVGGRSSFSFLPSPIPSLLPFPSLLSLSLPLSLPSHPFPLEGGPLNPARWSGGVL